jgi:hypothetical protein
VHALACCSFAWVKYFHDKRHYKGTVGQRKPKAPEGELLAAERSELERMTPEAFVAALLADKQSRTNTRSQFRGVSWKKAWCAAWHSLQPFVKSAHVTLRCYAMPTRSRKWEARFKQNRREKYLGTFDSEVDAALAYNKCALP